MPKFKKRPVIIEAEQWNGDFNDMLRIQKQFPEMTTHRAGYHPERNTLSDWAIKTQEGTMAISPGDFIIKEPFSTADRKFYPCKPDIFEKTYEPVND